MTIGSILLGLALLVLVGLFIARPIVRPTTTRRSKFNRRQALLDEKEGILVQIRSLDFDYDTGKLLEEDYLRKREAFMAEGEEIFRQLDELEGRAGAAEPVVPAVATEAVATKAVVAERQTRDDDIEAAINRRRQKTTASAPSAPAKAAPVKDAPVKDGAVTDGSVKNGSEGEARFCPECGRPTDADDKFCSSCGHKLLQPQHA